MPKEAPGLEEYTPTRLDWLTVILNSTVQGVNLQPDFQLLYTPAPDGKTIVLAIQYHADLDKERIDLLIDRAENFVYTFASLYGWESWIETKKDINIVEEQNRK